MERKRPIIQEKINQVTKHIEIPESQFSDKVDDMPVVVQRQASMVQKTVQKTMEIPQLQCVDKVVDDSVVQVPQIHVVEKTVEGTQLQIVEKTVKTPETQITQGTHTSESMGTVTARQVVEIEAYLPAESASSLDTVVDISVAMQQQAPGTQQVQTTIETSQLQFIDRSVDVPVASLKQVPTMQSNQKPVNVPHVQHIDKVVGVPVVLQRQAPTIQTEQKTTEVPQIQCLELLVDVPVVTQQTAEIPQVPPMDRICHVPVMAQRQGPSDKKELEELPADMMTSGQGSVAQIMQKTCENPQEQSNSEVIHVSEVKQRRVSTGIQTDRTVEVPRVIPQERILKPTGERASVRERVRQFERNGGASCSNNVEVPRAAPGDRQSEEAEDEAPSKRRKQESDIEPQIPVHFSLCNGSSEQEAKSVDDSAELETRVRGECEPVARLDDILSEMRDVKTELLQVRELVGVLVRRERYAEVKTEVAARRLDRMEREKDDADDAEREADLQEALTDQSKVAKLIVDKWFVDKGFGFGRTTTGEVVFIHASVVQGAEVLMVGTDAWAQVVSDHARAEGGVPSKESLGAKRVETRTGQGEGEPSGTTSKASSGAHGRTGSSDGEEGLRGVRPATGP